MVRIPAKENRPEPSPEEKAMASAEFEMTVRKLGTVLSSVELVGALHVMAYKLMRDHDKESKA
jgi:hypothetical protein